MEKNQIRILVIVSLVVAVITSVITTSITGGVINVKEIRTGTTVYTSEEVDAKIDMTDSSESYLLKVVSITEDSSDMNYTTISNVITGTQYVNKKTGDILTIGNIKIIIGKINRFERTVELSVNGYIEKLSDKIVYDKDTDEMFMVSVKK